MKKFLQKIKNMIFKEKRSRCIKIGVHCIPCEECEKLNKATDIYSRFSWAPNKNDICKAIAFDKNTKEILLIEERILDIIQTVNPAQQPRALRLINEKEYKEKLLREEIQR